jgi:hypothetical protein
MANGAQHLAQVSRYRKTPPKSRLTTMLRASGLAAASVGCFSRPRSPACREFARHLPRPGCNPPGLLFARVTIPHSRQTRLRRG